MIYWCDPEGRSPPESALFSLYPFSRHEQPLQLKGIQRVNHLPEPQKVAVISESFLPKKDNWSHLVHQAHTQKMQKIVLARQKILELEKEADPLRIVSSLKQVSQNAFVFCLIFNDFAFLGASPERLFYRKKRQFRTDAMAGTRSRGKSMTEDLCLEQALLNSQKDLSEIIPVQSFLSDQLTSLCESLSFSPFSIKKTSTVQHLYSEGTGILHPDISDHQIIEKIHPTPALAGLPQAQALDWIEAMEPFSRDLYGGVLGWQTDEESQWIVMIRCCLLKKKTAILYAGTGIVAGSDPEQEWAELNDKTALYDTIFVS